jgi:hypothetical protein
VTRDETRDEEIDRVIGLEIDGDCALRSSTSARRFCQSTKLREREMAVSRLRISRAASAGLCAPARARRKRRFAAASPLLMSISSSASRFAPWAPGFGR